MSKWQCVQSNGARVLGFLFFFAIFRLESHVQLQKPLGADWKGMGVLQEGLLLPPGFGSINRQCDPGRKGWETKLRQCCGQRPGIGWNINAPCVRLKNKKN